MYSEQQKSLELKQYTQVAQVSMATQRKFPLQKAVNVIQSILTETPSQKMSFQKILELQDYIQNKLADLETAKDGSLEQFIKNVESLIEKGFTFTKDDNKSLNQRSSHILQEELSPERQKFKMIKETIDKSRRAKSTMREIGRAHV